MDRTETSFARRLFGSVTPNQLLLIAVCIAFYSLLFGWKLALIFIGAMFFHEFGHAVAMVCYGQRVAGFYALPPFGLAVATKDPWPNRKAEAVIALMGPAWGLFMAGVIWLIYGRTGIPVLAGLVGWVALLNLFNLIPMNPMDGGRVVKSMAFSLSTVAGFIALGAGLVLTAYLAYTWIHLIGLLVLFMGYGEFRREIREHQRQQDRKLMIKVLSMKFGVEETPEAVLAVIDGRLKELTAARAEDAAELCGEEMAAEDEDQWEAMANRLACAYAFSLRESLLDLRLPHKTLLTGRDYFATADEELMALPYDGDVNATPLGKYLRASSQAPMSKRAVALVFLAYAGLIAALGWLTVNGLSVMSLMQVIKALR